MGEMLRLLPAAVSLIKEPAIADSKRSTTSPASSDKTVTAPPMSFTADVEPQTGRGSAIFSTDLGSRVLRGPQDARYVRTIARTDMVRDVVAGAGNWLRKYPYQYLNIFPQQGWQIDDLWDDYDIQTEGEVFFKEVLGFIERDNVVRAQKYAYDWALTHPERQTIVGSDTAQLYDRSNPLSIVDKLFVNGESREYPPVFLWKVAHFMRTSMLAVKDITSPIKGTFSTSEYLGRDQKDPVVHSTVRVPAAVEGTANAPAATSTTARSLTPAVKPIASTSNTHTAPTWHQQRQSPRISAITPAHGRFAEPIGSVGYPEPMGHVLPVLPAHQAGGLNVVHHGLRNPRTRPGRSSSGSYNQIMPANPYVENMTRIPSGLGPRQHADPMSMVQSPRFNQAHIAVSHPMGNVPPDMVHFAYDQGPMGPAIFSGQPHPAGAMHPGMVPPHTIQGPPMAHGYPRQPSSSQGPPYPVPMADMTNMHGMPPHNMDPRRPGDRRLGQQHANGSALYDPYEGNNPAFRTAGYSGGKKYNHNSLHNSNGRQRKTSFPGNRPYHGQYTNGRPQAAGTHILGPKPYSEDDRAVTQDREYGCYIDWIGPRNETVNELFVKDLPGDIHDAELEVLFQERLGVKPTSVNVRSAYNTLFAQQNQSRRHAFVGFPTAAIAKQALVIHSPTIRGLPVSITVPKRFFQKTLDVPPRDMVEAGPSAYSRYTSNPNNREDRDRVSSIHEESGVLASTTATKEKLSYSLQDARSDLHKKKKGKQIQQAQTTARSPEARKAKPKKRPESPTKEKPTARAETVETHSLNVSAKTDCQVSASVFPEATLGVNIQTDQNQANGVISSTVAKEEVVEAAEENDFTLKPGASDHAPKVATNDPPQAVQELVDLQPQKAVKPHIESTVKESPAKPQMHFEDTIAKSAPTTSLDLEDPVSDDELKNDASFHSAAESHSDIEAKVDPKAGSDIANDGTTLLAPEANTADTISTPDPSISSTKTIGEDTVVPSKGIIISTTVASEASMSDSKSTTVLPVRSKAETAAATQQEITTPTLITSVAGSSKKNGAQHTESITPFLSKKALATQQKKEREQRKKAQKKEKELAQKAKAEKVAASKTTTKSLPAENVTNVKANGTVDKTNAQNEVKLEVDAQSAGTSAVPPALAQDVGKLHASPKEPASAAPPPKAANDSRDKPGRRKGMKTDASATKDTAPAEVKSDDHGKQTNGTSIPNETGSVTNKDAKVDPQKIPQEILGEDALALPARSSSQDDTKKPSSGVPESSPAVPSAHMSTPSGKKKNKKKKKNPTVNEGETETKKTLLAWPDLEFRPKSPNPPWMGPIDMETDVQNYEEIMDEVCGGPDDSDFSWSDLPMMEDVVGSDKDDVRADEGGSSSQHAIIDVDVQKRKGFCQTLFPKIRKLQPDFATEIMRRILTFNTDEIAKLAIDNSSLVAKVDEMVLFGQGQNVAATKNAWPVTTQSRMVAREETVARGIAALDTQIAAKKEELKAADANLAVFDKQLTERTDSQETSSIEDGRIAALEAQLAATRAETRAAEENIAVFDKQHGIQEASDMVVPDSQPAKKKKPNKHKNKKKKKKVIENGDPSQSGDTAGITSSTDSTPSKAAVDSINSEEPFMHQMKIIDALKQDHSGAADSQGSAQFRGGATTPTDEPTLMRTMEAYFREAHPHRVPKGRKVSMEDLQ